MLESLTAKVDRLFTAWDRPDSPGCALGIIKSGELIYSRGYGMANLEHAIPISSKTVFDIASTSKQFTAICIALLAEQGKIALDDDIRDYLPEMPVYESPITIRHLVHHTSGIRDYLELMSLAGMSDADHYTNDEVIEMLARQKELNFKPGDQYLYSNTGYFLLSLIVKRASGKSLHEFAAENIFNPLGMKKTHFHDDHTMIVKDRAIGYSPSGDDNYRINMTTLDMVGDGGIFTTVEELFLWDQNFYHNKLGKGDANLMAQVLTPGTLNSGERLDYAFGLIIGDYNGMRMVSHGGAFVGFRAEMIRFPEQEFTVICLANLSSINPGQLARQVADVYLADQVKARGNGTVEPQRIELPAQELQDKVGLYHSPITNEILKIFMQEEGLAAEKSGFAFILAPVSPLKFRAVEAPVSIEIQFERSDRNQPWSVRLLIEGKKPDTLQRVEVVSPTADQLTAYVGDYFSAELQTTYRIVLEDDKLFARYRNSPPDSLQPAQSDIFRVGGVMLHFLRNDAGEVEGFVVNAGRVRNIRFTRKY
ncbi:MAG: Penicillin-binding protein 4* [Chloroflexi bacterium]|nr:Penicillin-binding protein 4* [Chloroflexota bacterium]